MKNINIYLFTSVILLGICLYFIFQWDQAKNESNHLNSVQEQLIFNHFTHLTEVLNDAANTLNKYDDGFTKQEKDLYHQSLHKDLRSLNEIGHNLTYLLNPANLNGTLIYEQYVWKLEVTLNEIINGKVTDEKMIHSIGKAMKKQNKRLSDIFYGKKQVGVKGINTENEITKVREILNELNEELEEKVK
jgi:hypothetical protein